MARLVFGINYTLKLSFLTPTFIASAVRANKSTRLKWWGERFGLLKKIYTEFLLVPLKTMWPHLPNFGPLPSLS